MSDVQSIETPQVLSDKYRYIDLLGEGSNGKTWRARNIIDGNIVAIKELKFSQVENLKSFELFKREAEVLESVNIKGVPKFYESIFTEGEDAACYLIQEFVSETAIQTYLEKGRKFTEKETLMVLLQISVILESLHTKYHPPIIHRDIKPSNIMCTLSESGAVSQAWLIDFGAVANPQNKSGGSTVAGTYGYMAPEQMIGECTTVSDIYAMGATALHMLTGKPPYEIQSDVFRLKYDEVLNECAPNVSQGMRALLRMLLEPTPQKRLQTAAELTDMLGKLLKGELIELQETTDDDDNEDNTSSSIQKSNKSPRSKKGTIDRIKNLDIINNANNWLLNDSWITVPGTVVNVIDEHNYHEFEYIYEVDTGLSRPKKITCVGLMTTEHYNNNDFDRIPIPSPCVVKHHPVEPAISLLESINNIQLKLQVKPQNTECESKHNRKPRDSSELENLLQYIKSKS